MELTNEEKHANLETMKHIDMVRRLLSKIIILLLERSEKHDLSKLSPPEATIFSKYIDLLSQYEYGSDAYYQCRSLMSSALDHHYANNRHHPEHFRNGIDDMNLVDILEMLCDWKAASTRCLNGDINQSLAINANRFNISPQLLQIFRNTLPLFDQ